MKPLVSTVLFVASVLALSTTSAGAQGMSLGEFEYRNSCIACHGPAGAGDGPIARYLVTDSLPSLAMLKKNNGGVFPVRRVYAMIDGTDDVAVHGGRDMPVWGERYRARIDESDNPDFSPKDIDDYATTRILALIEYLSTLQAE